MSDFSLLVVIVNYKRADLTIDCLDSLVPQARALGGGCRVVVCDNASGNDDAAELDREIVARGYGDVVTLVASETNLGFAGGNNLAIRAMADHGQPEFVLLLNNDTIVRDRAIEALLAFMASHPDCGIAGSRLEDPDPPEPQLSAFRFPNVASEFERGLRLGLVSRLLGSWRVAPPHRDHSHRTGWVAGASMLIRGEVLERVGLLDSDYFMYYEETDFCLAAARAGYSCWYVPESRVVHLVGQASGVTKKAEGPGRGRRRPAYWFESRRRYFIKNHGRLYATVADAAFLVAYGLFRLRAAVTRRPMDDPEHFFSDFFSHSVFVKGYDLDPAR